MGYIEVWAKYASDNVPVATKKALRELLSQDLDLVRLESVGGLNAPFNGPVTELREGTTLIACGPDPFTKRNWWANIKFRGGKAFVDDKPIKPKA